MKITFSEIISRETDENGNTYTLATTEYGVALTVTVEQPDGYSNVYYMNSGGGYVRMNNGSGEQVMARKRWGRGGRCLNEGATLSCTPNNFLPSIREMHA